MLWQSAILCGGLKYRKTMCSDSGHSLARFSHETRVTAGKMVT